LCAAHEVVDLEPTGYAPAQARRAVREVVAAHVSSAQLHTAELLVSELVTNAIVHGAGRVRVAIDCAEQELSVTVSDDEPEPPRLEPERPMSLGGRGIRMVDSLAGAWGVNPQVNGHGKDVWFRLP
jgi:anti-sigma regulatory factor (Ser/Thr protein kinase)